MLHDVMNKFSHIKHNTSFPFEMISDVEVSALKMKFPFIFNVDRGDVFWNMIYKNHFKRVRENSSVADFPVRMKSCRLNLLIYETFRLVRDMNFDMEHCFPLWLISKCDRITFWRLLEINSDSRQTFMMRSKAATTSISLVLRKLFNLHSTQSHVMSI